MGNGDSFHTETCAVLQATINRDAYVTQSLAKSGKDLTNLDPDDAVDALQMRAQAVKYKDILPNMHYAYSFSEKIYQEQDENAGDLTQTFQPRPPGSPIDNEYVEVHRTCFAPSAQNLFLELLNHESMGARLKTYSGIAALEYMCGHPLTDKDQLLARHATLRGLADLDQYDFYYLQELVKSVGNFEEALISMDFTTQEQLELKKVFAATAGAAVLPALGAGIALFTGGLGALPTLLNTGLWYIVGEGLWDTGSWIVNKAITQRAVWRNHITPVLKCCEPNTSIIKGYGGLIAKQCICQAINPAGNPLVQPIVYMPVNVLKQGFVARFKQWRKRSNLSAFHKTLVSYFSLVQQKLYELCSDSRLSWLNNEWVDAQLEGKPVEDTEKILALFGKLDVYLQLVAYVQATQRNGATDGTVEYFIDGFTFGQSAPLIYNKDATIVIGRGTSELENRSLQAGGDAALAGIMDVLLKAQVLCITNRPNITIRPIKLQDSYRLLKARDIQVDLHMEPIA